MATGRHGALSTTGVRSLRSGWIAATAPVLLALVLRTYNLAANGQNLYYAAGVRSMLDSWHNFFYVSFDPSGALSIDKPPLGLWAQAGAAKLFGFHYWALALPQVAAGTAAVAVLYRMVRPRYGLWPAVLSATFLAVMPASVASARNNSLDTLTMLLMLLCAWAMLRAIDTGAFRWLALAATLAGLAFNTKMFAAFVPLPAFAFAYVLAQGIRSQLRPLLGAAAILAAVAFAWVAAVGFTPARDRPYIYNGYGNSIWQLTFRYNGINRVLGSTAQPRVRATGGYTEPPPDLTVGARAPARSPLRLVTGKLGSQVGWFLPLAGVGAVVLLVGSRRRAPDSVLWTAWLASGLVLFSVARDVKPPYLEAISAPIAVCGAIGACWLVSQAQQRPLHIAAACLLLGAFAASLLWTVDDTAGIALLAMVLAAVAAAALGVQRMAGAQVQRLLPAAIAALLLTAIVGPLSWSAVTALEPATGSAARYPVAGPDDLRDYPPAPGGDFPAIADPHASATGDPVLDFLLENNTVQSYLVLTERSLFGNAPRYILATNRPVLTLDSFDDQAVAAATLAHLVDEGRLRFMELPAIGPWSDPQLAFGQWFLDRCTDITSARLKPLGGPHLYDCQRR